MKVILIFSALVISISASAQKITLRSYKHVDTVNKYSNAEVIIYRDILGKRNSDTIYYKNKKYDIRILSVDVVNIYDDKKLKKHKQ